MMIDSLPRGLMLLLGLTLLRGAIGQAQPANAAAWDTYSDTWAATDALGRTLPDFASAGPPRQDKTVGIFYFLTLDEAAGGPYDNTQILKAHPEAMLDINHPAWGPTGSAHFWGEPLFGYYASDDPYVLAKHAHILSNAGVDAVFFDVSNAVTYDRVYHSLGRVWSLIRRNGGQTPAFAFHCPFGNSSNMGTRTLLSLYDNLYSKNLYSDLWFRWQGKPLVIADPEWITAEAILQARSQGQRQPAELAINSTLGQSFTAARSFTAVGGEFPTWMTTTAGMTLSLYANAPGGKLLARQAFSNVRDNATVLLEAGKELPPGRYYLEMSAPIGHIGWWSNSGESYEGGQAFDGGQEATGDRSLWIRYPGDPAATKLSPHSVPITLQDAAALAQRIRDFFSFRLPIAPYNIQTPPLNHWAWLQIYPQTPQRDAQGNVEQVSVGVAQNYNATVNNTAPMSFPGAFGRSYHNGSLDTRPDATLWGYNFAEQWEHALQLDPPFVFVTGWNEWTAGKFEQWVQWKAPPPVFVDQFNQEFSRDIEPAKAAIGDNYLYQLTSFVRRYKGVRPLPAITPRSIAIDGRFADWQGVGPEFRDAIGDPAHRDFPGYGKAGPYRNATGRNDLVAAKVSYDARNVTFYLRAHDPLQLPIGSNALQLFLNADGNAQTGWLGYDWMVDGISPSGNKAILSRHNGGYTWSKVATIPLRVRGSELELAIPRRALGLARLPAALDFKWADNCIQKGEWSDFTLNGDAAPDDRFNYRAKLQ